jgi:hypothetical protein
MVKVDGRGGNRASVLIAGNAIPEATLSGIEDPRHERLWKMHT